MKRLSDPPLGGCRLRGAALVLRWVNLTFLRIVHRASLPTQRALGVSSRYPIRYTLGGIVSP